MLIIIIILFTFYFEISQNLMAYDSANQFLNIPHNEIHVITDAIDNYRPNLRVRFINFQNVKRRRTLTATQIKDGLIQIENKNHAKSSVTSKVENVKLENDEKIELRFGGGSKAHYPYNRVVAYYGRNLVPFTTKTTPLSTTTIPPTPPPINPRKWAVSTTTSIAPNYSAHPALYLPSRFSQRKENIVIVYKKN